MSGHEFTSYFPESGSVDLEDTSTSIDETTYAELRELASRYPQPRSALLPMLHLVQSVDGRISPKGIEACAEVLGITTAQVSGVATFYTMYKRRPAGQHHVGVCTTALCAVMGGDALLETASKHLGIGPDETTPDGKISLERIECNAACDFAPVMMVNWEFMDDMTPEKAVTLLDDLTAGREVRSTRGATLTSWREAERVIAGFPDGRADEGPSAGTQSLLGLRIAQEKGWSAPKDAGQSPKAVGSVPTEAASGPATQAQQAAAGADETPEAKVPPKQRRKATKPGEGTAK
jgi:NADH-quinone oxidoreductase subunit E